MRTRKIVRNISILAYCFIILKGQMIAFPFILFIILTAFGIEGLLAMIASIIGLLGLALFVTYEKNKITDRTVLIEVFILVLLVIPIVERVTAVSIYLFNYSAFIIPTFCFMTCYILSMCLTLKEKMKQQAP